MKNRFIFFVTFLFIFSESCGQFHGENFIINGNINLNSGTIHLNYKEPNDSVFHTQLSNTLFATISGGKFQLKGILDFSRVYSIKVSINDSCKYLSDFFLVDGGIQNLEIDINEKMPKISNKSMEEYYNSKLYSANRRLQKDKKWFKLFSDSLSTIYESKMPDSLKNVISAINTNQIEREIVLKSAFYEKMKNSYLALWSLYEDFYSNGFKGIYEDFFSMLSVEIQKSKYGISLKSKLNEANPTRIGAFFPQYTYRNLKNNQFEKMIFRGKYTLVDFWSIRCSQCIAQFSEYKEIYKTYSSRGFDVIHVSVEYSNQVSFLQKIRKKYNLEWHEYLDENQVNYEMLQLPSFFPNSFLVRDDGLIIKKYINPNELKLFLEDTLN
jgi:peroxiredoxin